MAQVLSLALMPSSCVTRTRYHPLRQQPPRDNRIHRPWLPAGLSSGPRMGKPSPVAGLSKYRALPPHKVHC